MPQDRPKPLRDLTLIVWPGLAFLVCFLLQGRIDGSDAAGYVTGARNLIENGSADPASYYQQRLGMTLPLGLVMMLFDWAPWSAVLPGAVACAAIVWCVLRMVRPPEGDGVWRGLLCTLAVPGLYKWGGLVYPDVLVTALSSLAMYLLIVWRPQQPDWRRGIVAGLLLGWMVAVNPTMLRFGVVVVAAGVTLWLANKDAGVRRTLLRCAGGCAGGFLGVLGLVALVQGLMNGNPMLLYTALTETKPTLASGAVAQGGFWRWMRGAFGPLGEFGLLPVFVVFWMLILLLGWRRRMAPVMVVHLLWLWLPILLTMALVVPPMLRAEAGAGEISSRYVLPAVVPVMFFTVLVFTALLKQPPVRTVVLAVILAVSGLALLQNASPRLLTTGAPDHLAEFRVISGTGNLYASPRLARQLSIEWGALVRPWQGGSLEASGVYLMDVGEEEFLQRKYGKTLEVPTGLSSTRLSVNATTIWERARLRWLAFKAGLSGAEEPTRVVARYRIFRTGQFAPDGRS